MISGRQYYNDIIVIEILNNINKMRFAISQNQYCYLTQIIVSIDNLFNSRA